jgi:hypothetical protein
MALHFPFYKKNPGRWPGFFYSSKYPSMQAAMAGRFSLSSLKALGKLSQPPCYVSIQY